MQTIEEILSAAALLSPADLGKLRSAIERLDRRANAVVLQPSGQITFRLYRQTDLEYGDSLRQSLAIDEDYGFYLHLHCGRQPDQELNLARVYLTLKHLAGESSRYLDDSKMAFSFPFALDVIKRNQTFAYLLNVRNIRDSLYFTLRKLVAPDDNRLKKGYIHPPFEDEFGKAEMRSFRRYLYGYLLGRWESLKPEHLQPFVRRVPADLIILGYCDGKAFEEQFESSETYESAWQRLQAQVEREREAKQADPCVVRDERSPGGRG
jgi:hypothetical protein